MWILWCQELLSVKDMNWRWMSKRTRQSHDRILSERSLLSCCSLPVVTAALIPAPACSLVTSTLPWGASGWVTGQLSCKPLLVLERLAIETGKWTRRCWSNQAPHCRHSSVRTERWYLAESFAWPWCSGPLHQCSLGLTTNATSAWRLSKAESWLSIPG